MARNQRDELQTHHFSASTGKAGATATVGYVNTGSDKDLVTLAQNATADTWIIPITSLKRGSIITRVGINGQGDSGGNAWTVDYELRVTTSATAGVSDASVQTGTQIGASADAALTGATTLATPETVLVNKHYYVLITCTTAGVCDIELQGITLEITEN